MENHRDVAILRRDVVDSFVADEDVALRDLLEAGDHAQRGRFSATRGPDEHDELTVRDLEADIVDRGHVSAFVAGINFGNVFDGNLGHSDEAPN